MANRNTKGFGLIPQGTIGSTPATGGQGKYLIDAGMAVDLFQGCLLYTSPSPRDGLLSRMPSSA